jgi:GntR family transcriptional regulator
MAEHPAAPLHYRIFRALQERIADQGYKVGDRLPTEEALCREFGVSRITVRRAIGRLVELGQVIRTRGSGSFVSAPVKRVATPLAVTGTLESLFAQIESTTVKSVEIAQEPAPERIARVLGLPPGEVVVRVRRVRAFKGQLLALTINYLPREIGTRLRESELYRVPLVQLFEERFGKRIASADQTIEARAADADVAEALGIRFGDPVLYTERVMTDAEGRSFEVMRSYYRSDVYQIRVQLVRRRQAAFGWQFRDTGRA